MPKHFIECDGMIQGRRHTWFAERDTDRMGWQNTIDDIRDMQVENVAKVYRVEDGRWSDVTREAAQEVLARCDVTPHWQLENWIEEVLGAFACAGLVEA